MKSFKEFLLEMPQYYPGKIAYMGDKKFTPISLRNIQDYTVLHQDEEFVYVVDPGQTAGYVFDMHDIQNDPQKVIPVMKLALRPTDIKDYKQVNALRIRESYSKRNITSQWYDSYIKTFGGVVSDKEHLEGGRTLWLSFIKIAEQNPYEYRITVVDALNNEIITDTKTSKLDPETIWSLDPSKKHIVLVFEYLKI